MALAQITLYNELMALGLYDTEIDAINVWADAWSNYFAQAQANAPILPGCLPAAKSALKGAMTGFATNAASALQAGITAWWGSLSAAPATTFAACVIIAPPAGLTGLAASLTAVFSANVAAKNDKSTAFNAIATVLHAATLGGMATIPPPPGQTYPIV